MILGCSLYSLFIYIYFMLNQCVPFMCGILGNKRNVRMFSLQLSDRTYNSCNVSNTFHGLIILGFYGMSRNFRLSVPAFKFLVSLAP
jgi:hypothetical protein